MGITTNGLVLYLPLYSTDLQGSPITSKDSNQHSCTVTGALWSSRGRDFDGIDNVITVPHSATLNLGTNWTIIVWAKVDSEAGHVGIVSKDNNIDLKSFTLTILDTGELALIHHISNVEKLVISTDTFEDSTWHQFVGVNDGTDLRIYADTVLKGTGAGQGGATDNDGADLFIGLWRTSLSEYLDGTIGEVLIVNRLCAVSEIAHIYNSTKWRYV